MWFLRNFCGGEHRSLLCGSIGPSSVFGSCAKQTIQLFQCEQLIFLTFYKVICSNNLPMTFGSNGISRVSNGDV